MTIDNIKQQIANEKGYPSWGTMEDFIIDHNHPVNVCILIKSTLEEVYERYIELKRVIDGARAKKVILNLIKEFDNPDNHAHQRDAIQSAKFLIKLP